MEAYNVLFASQSEAQIIALRQTVRAACPQGQAYPPALPGGELRHTLAAVRKAAVQQASGGEGGARAGAELMSTLLAQDDDPDAEELLRRHKVARQEVAMPIMLVCAALWISILLFIVQNYLIALILTVFWCVCTGIVIKNFYKLRTIELQYICLCLLRGPRPPAKKKATK